VAVVAAPVIVVVVVVAVTVPVAVAVATVCPGRVVVLTEVVVMVMVAVVVMVVDSDVAVSVAVFETVAEFPVDDSVVVELALGVEELVLECETVVDNEDSEPTLVEVVAEVLACKTEEPTSPQPARREVAAATSSRLAKATLNPFKLATKRRKPRFHHKYFCPNARTNLHHGSGPRSRPCARERQWSPSSCS
jgi:hypothetical protein